MKQDGGGEKLWEEAKIRKEIMKKKKVTEETTSGEAVVWEG